MKKLLLAGAAVLALAAASPVPANAAGDIIITYKDDVSTLDPAIGYDWQNWSIIKSLFDGLMDYKPGTTELVPDLAESYEITQRRQDLHLQAPPRREIPQRPRGHRRRREIFDRARARPGDAEPGRRLLRLDRDDHRRRSAHHQVRSLAAGRDLPACHGDQLRPCRAEGGGRRSSAPTSASTRSAAAPSSSGNGRSASASSSSGTPTTGSEGVPEPRQESPSSSARSRPSRCFACRRARSTCSATASRRRSSSRSRTTRNTKARSSRAASSTPAT